MKLPRLRLLSSPTHLYRRFLSTTSPRLDSYAFVGLGQMGYPMARNLQANLTPDDSITLFDVNREAVKSLAQDVQSRQGNGATVHLANSAPEASQDADTLITCLPEPIHVKKAYASFVTKDLPRREKPRLYIDCSTIDPTSSREVAAMISRVLPDGAGVFVDAPMSGSVVGATAGTLTFMLGAAPELVPRVEPILRRMGQKVFHCGLQGTGLSAKLANNYMLAINNIATAEAMNMGIKCGLDPHVLASIVNVSTGRCWPSLVNNPVKGVVNTAASNDDYLHGFGISLMRKDLNLARAGAQQVGAKLVLADAARELYEAAEKDEKCAGRDFSVVYRYIGGDES